MQKSRGLKMAKEEHDSSILVPPFVLAHSQKSDFLCFLSMHLFLGRRTDEDFTALPFWLMICRCHGRKVDKSSFFERKLTTICNRFWGQASSINKYRDDCQSTARLDFKHCWRIEIDLPFLNYCASAHAWHIFDHKWWESRPIASSVGRKNETAFSNQRWRDET